MGSVLVIPWEFSTHGMLRAKPLFIFKAVMVTCRQSGDLIFYRSDFVVLLDLYFLRPNCDCDVITF